MWGVGVPIAGTRPEMKKNTGAEGAGEKKFGVGPFFVPYFSARTPKSDPPGGVPAVGRHSEAQKQPPTPG